MERLRIYVELLAANIQSCSGVIGQVEQAAQPEIYIVYGRFYKCCQNN